MPNNIPHILIPSNVWVDLYSLSGIAVGQPLTVENVGVCDIYLAVQAVQPDPDHKAYNVLKRDDDIRLTNNQGDAGAWAFCGDKGLISVSINNGFQPLLNAAMNDGFGNPLSSFHVLETGNHVLDVHSLSVHSNIVNNQMRQQTLTATVLDANSAADDFQIVVTDATGFSVGDAIHINTSAEEITLPVIISSTPALPTTGIATLTLDRRMDNAHNIGDDVTKVIVNMALQDGTMANPQIYFVAPPPGEVFHITRLLFEATHNSSGDLGKFLGIAALENGVVLRSLINGVHGTFANWKSNGDMKADMFDVEFDARSGGQGVYGTSGRGTFQKAGAVIRLDGDTNDKIELYVQDTLTGLGLESYTMKMQGHPE